MKTIALAWLVLPPLGPILVVMILGVILPMNFLVTFLQVLDKLDMSHPGGGTDRDPICANERSFHSNSRRKRFVDNHERFFDHNYRIDFIFTWCKCCLCESGQHLGSAIVSLTNNNQILIPLGFVRILVGFCRTEPSM